MWNWPDILNIWSDNVGWPTVISSTDKAPNPLVKALLISMKKMFIVSLRLPLNEPKWVLHRISDYFFFFFVSFQESHNVGRLISLRSPHVKLKLEQDPLVRLIHTSQVWVQKAGPWGQGVWGVREELGLILRSLDFIILLVSCFVLLRRKLKVSYFQFKLCKYLSS